MTDQPLGKLSPDPSTRSTRKGRSKEALEIAFDPMAVEGLDLSKVLGETPAPDPFAEIAEPEGKGSDADRAGKAASAPRQSEKRADAAKFEDRDSDPVRREAEAAPEEQSRDAEGPAEAPSPFDRKARQRAADAAANRLGLSPTLARIEVTVTVEVGRTRMTLSEIASVSPGELVALDRMTDEPVDVLVNGRLFARGEIVALGTSFGVRLVELAGDAP